jgi:carbamoyltransferase
MVICGLKLTHDGAVALIDNGRLVFCYEMEKLGNRPRYSELRDFSIIPEILGENGYRLEDVDRFVIDGWGDIENQSGSTYTLNIQYGEEHLPLTVARYGHLVGREDILEGKYFRNDKLNFEYNSYMHVSGHVLGAYCTSPFAQRGESAFILTWDGGMCPQLFYFDALSGVVENLRPLFLLNGNTYCFFAQNYEPYLHTDRYDKSIGGKVMAYIALGEVKAALLNEFKDIYANRLDKSEEPTEQLIRKFVDHGEAEGHRSVDMIATFHVFLEELLVDSLGARVKKYPGYTRNLCFTGGCALNIKWNSAIRSSGIFKEMWVPPFPNDSGSAIGTACCEMVKGTGNRHLQWNVYGGPLLINNGIDALWEKCLLSFRQLAEILHETHEPVVVLNGRAELGPRALGNRSILAPAVEPLMKDVLNKIKKREDYRPVSPICLEEDAPEIFSPGVPDPLMLYDHKVKDDWKDRIPAVCHLDGTARLQTINKEQNRQIYELLKEYKRLSGIPLLCNTSANFKGKGFFPDVVSAMKWGKVNFIWSHDVLYFRKGYESIVRQWEEAKIEVDGKQDDFVILDL